ncbi:11493_t:CDS:2, partial [Racocetra fulgida]
DANNDANNNGAERLSQSQKSYDHSSHSSHSFPSNQNQNDIINNDSLQPQQSNILKNSNNSNTNLSINPSTNSAERYNPDLDDFNSNSDQHEPLNAHQHKSYLSTSSSQPSSLQNIPNNNKSENLFFQKRKKVFCLCCGVIALIILIMIPIFLFVIAPSVARNVVAESKISFNDVKLSNISEDNFSLSFTGAVSNTGPLSASISIPKGVTISFKDVTLGRMALDTINTTPSSGATLESTKVFKIVDKSAFSNFSKFMLTEKEFTWHLEGSSMIKVSGLTINDIELSKDVTLNGIFI